VMMILYVLIILLGMLVYIYIYIVLDCGSDVKLKKSDMVRCRECGYRIVYKKRTIRRK
jgi:DNA-directed RNA polymerase subunit RPC12/RpoP